MSAICDKFHWIWTRNGSIIGRKYDCNIWTVIIAGFGLKNETIEITGAHHKNLLYLLKMKNPTKILKCHHIELKSRGWVVVFYTAVAVVETWPGRANGRRVDWHVVRIVVAAGVVVIVMRCAIHVACPAGRYDAGCGTDGGWTAGGGLRQLTTLLLLIFDDTVEQLDVLDREPEDLILAQLLVRRVCRHELAQFGKRAVDVLREVIKINLTRI